MHAARAVPTTLAGALVAVLAAGCSPAAGDARTSGKPAAVPVTFPAAAPVASSALPGASSGTASASEPRPVTSPVTSPSTSPSTAPSTSVAPPAALQPGAAPPASAAPEPPGSTRTRPAELSIPSIGVTGLRVVPYEGTTDDWPGTRIQNRGVAASPYGERGGVGPGEIGNYLVTAHRLSAGGPLRDLPSLEIGDVVLVTSGGKVYEYRITAHRTTSFRSARSLAEQRAAVPGFPGRTATRPMITISTCATPEDNAAGNFWRDDRDNPEHRIDRVGVLTGVRETTG
ncbi:sortase [Streptomyces sp. PKU-MA01144]|uniref:class E sortase n=1 Tax=Streptomyces sp. PKU-MA01144 TaxID=2729138 RepID=UPI00147FE3AF|nr:class E sortase [Streptomyces sp. PKU-MA01144]NNJ04980.1 sortase [Streptomyces sp. PKU-MA01144]